MRITAFPIVLLAVIGSSVCLAQQSPNPIEGPGPAASPPPLTPPQAAPPPPAAAVPALPSAPALQAPRNTPDSAESAEATTANVRAVPCSRSARETDGTTTCIGIPERRSKPRRQR
jgi:hypothetical protein